MYFSATGGCNFTEQAYSKEHGSGVAARSDQKARIPGAGTGTTREDADMLRFFANQDGKAVRLVQVWHDGAVSAAASHFTGMTADGVTLQCARKIDYKKNPSLHKCGDKCRNAKGPNCECACGGHNHGAGYSA
jgi:hypothetical protein